MGIDAVAEATAESVGTLAAFFMLDPVTYQTGAQHGFSGIDFYFAGRAGVLGDVSADVVTSALVFFAPDHVRASWEQGRDVMPRAEAVDLFASCLRQWSRDHLGDGPDWGRLAELAGKVADAASIAGAPVFAGWRALPVPDEPREAALHRMNLLRELRMARHGAAVVALGIDPVDAVRHRSPSMVGLFGWEAAVVSDEVTAVWEEAEALTNRATDHDYACLDADEKAELAALGEAALAVIR